MKTWESPFTHAGADVDWARGAATDVENWRHGDVAVLCSGGLDSAILVGELARTAQRLAPLYVRFGLLWEPAEECHLRAYLAALPTTSARIEPLRVFDMPIQSVYGPHWSTNRRLPPPPHDSPDEAVFLPGRNALLLTQTMLWCEMNRVPTLAMGPLASNPFPDASDAFFNSYQAMQSLALGGSQVRIRRPYQHLHKVDVMRRGIGMPLERSFSCIRPDEGRHCGRCNKCAERQHAFSEAGMFDPTEYAVDVSVACAPANH